MYVVYSALASLAFAVGGVFMKHSQGLTRLWPSLILFACFLVGAALMTLAMKDASLGLAYVFVLGMEAVFACVFGAVFFDDSYSRLHLLGIATIVGGLVILHVGDSPLAVGPAAGVASDMPERRVHGQR